MKFTNGYWMIRDGINALYAREAYELNVGEDKESLNVLAPTSVVHGRYDTLNLPTFNIDVTAPAEGVIRVVAGHWQGATEYPGFPLNADDAGDRDYVRTAAEGDGDGEVGQDGASISLTSGGLTAKVVKGSPWNLTFLGRDGKELTQSSGKSLGRFTLNGLSNVTAQPVGEFGVTMDGSAYDESDVFTAIQLRLGVGENVYGFGERFGAYVKNGQTIDIWNEDGGTASEQGYKDIPFYMTSNGYGVLVNNRGHVSFEVGSENTEAVQFSVPGETIDFCVIYGPTPKQILDRYTALVGRPANVPAWSYGLWLTTSFTTKYDEKTINSFIDGMAERDIPLSAFHYDCYWMREFHWTDFEWDKRFFGDIESTLKRLHEDKGLHICAWINPYIGQRGSMFKEGKDKGYLVKKANGEVWQTDFWQAGMGLVDFTNPEARDWFKGKVKALLHQGVDAIKTDFGERIPRDVVWYDGSPKLSMHTGTPSCTTRRYSKPLRRRTARVRRACSPAPRPSAASGSRCIGAATANRRSMAWHRPCVRACRSPVPDSASGAMTSAVSKEPVRIRRSTSAGWRSACWDRTHACTDQPCIVCRGCSTRRMRRTVW